jgi:hypothetical protein
MSCGGEEKFFRESREIERFGFGGSALGRYEIVAKSSSWLL